MAEAVADSHREGPAEEDSRAATSEELRYSRNGTCRDVLQGYVAQRDIVPHRSIARNVTFTRTRSFAVSAVVGLATCLLVAAPRALGTGDALRPNRKGRLPTSMTLATPALGKGVCGRPGGTIVWFRFLF